MSPDETQLQLVTALGLVDTMQKKVPCGFHFVWFFRGGFDRRILGGVI